MATLSEKLVFKEGALRVRFGGLIGSPPVGQRDRYIGGLAETLYVPGTLRDDLLAKLGCFCREVNCFPGDGMFFRVPFDKL